MVILTTWAWLGLAAADIAAHHEVALQGESIVVDTTWSAAAEGNIVLAVPLPPGAVAHGATAQLDADGAIVALVLDDPDATRPTVRIEVDAATVEAAGALPLPIAVGSDMQRVRVTGSLAFRPDPALGLLVHLGHTQPAGLGHRERRAIDARLPAERPRIGAIYIPTEAIVRAGGVVGAIEPRADGRQRTAIGIGVVFVVLCGAGGWAYRRARRHAEAEHAELVLAAEFDALENPGRGGSA